MTSITQNERILHTKITTLLNKALTEVDPLTPCHFLYLDYTSDLTPYVIGSYIYINDTINNMPRDCISRAYSDEPAKIFYFYMYGNRRKYVNWLVENFNLTYLENDYRKQYVLFKCDDINTLYTILKLKE